MPLPTGAAKVPTVALADRIEWLLNELKTSGRELARRAKIAEAIVNNIASGRSAKAESLEAIVRAVPGLNGHWLLIGEGPPFLTRRAPLSDPTLKQLGERAVERHYESRQAHARDAAADLPRVAEHVLAVKKQNAGELRAERTRRSAKKVAEGERKIVAEHAATEARRPRKKHA